MICHSKCLVLDLDGTICPEKGSEQSYADLVPYEHMVELVRQYKASGFYIIISTARTMRTYDGNVGRILANTARATLDWLDRHGIPYDEIHFGKPWAGRGGFYVDDRTVRPDEFQRLSTDEILDLLEASRTAAQNGRPAAGE
jgi:capsule biosynthesis phosphatase